jgi:putative transposase
MTSVLISLLLTLRGLVSSRIALHLEVLALRHQLQVLQRSRPRRLRLMKADRWLWAWLSTSWPAWRMTRVIVKPETVLAWHRQGFRWYWSWKSRCRIGRPCVPRDVRVLIRTMSQEKALWGAPRIHGELLKLGFHVSQASVAKYMMQTTIADLAHVPHESPSPNRSRPTSSSCRQPRAAFCSSW